MKMEKTFVIRHKLSGKKLFSFKCLNLKLCVEIAVALKANLESADLESANLRSADLESANLDFSCLPLWCGSLKANFDDKQIKQFLYHVLSGVKNSNNVSEELKRSLLTTDLLTIANEFHRIECERI